MLRTGAVGFVVPVSAPAFASVACAVLVSILAERLVQECKRGGNLRVESKMAQVLGPSLSGYITLHSVLSRLLLILDLTGGKEGALLAAKLGVPFISGSVEDAVDGFRSNAQSMVSSVGFGCMPATDGKSVRLLMTYFLAHMLAAKQQRQGFLLVVATGNRDVLGRAQSYSNDSAGDLAPISSWGNEAVREFLAGHSDLVKDIVSFPSGDPELEAMENLRTKDRCGPVSMFERLISLWPHRSPQEVSEKVKRFFTEYGTSRRKACSLPPGLHVSNADADDKRADLRPVICGSVWTYQFERIDEMVKRLLSAGGKK